MPDNKTYQTRLVDRGWSEMQRILDREMPRRKNRRFAFIWLGAAILIAAASVTLVQVAGTGPDTQENIIRQKTEPGLNTGHDQASPTAMHENSDQPDVIKDPSAGDAAFSGNGFKEAMDAHEVVNRTVETQSHGSDRTRALKVNTHQRISESSLPAMTGSVSEVSPGLRDVNTPHSVQSPHVGQNMHGTAMIATPLKPDGQYHHADDRQVSAVSVLATKPPEGLNSPKTLSGGAIIPRFHERKIGVDIIARAHLNGQGDPLYGAEAGIATVFRSHRRLQIQSGVSYGYYSRNGLGVFGGAQADELIDINSQPGNPGYTVTFDVEDVYANTIGYDSAKLLTDKFHYLHIPLSIAYQITPRLSAWGGAKASVLLAAPSRYRLDDSIFSANAGANTRSNSKSYLYDYDVLRKIDISPEVGISWQAFERVWLEAAYRHGMVPYINRSEVPERSDYHRSVSIGLRLRMI